MESNENVAHAATLAVRFYFFSFFSVCLRLLLLSLLLLELPVPVGVSRDQSRTPDRSQPKTVIEFSLPDGESGSGSPLATPIG